MARSTNPSPLDEQTLLRLQGGVRGRFARSFSVLQGAVNVLERYLQHHTNGAVQDDAEPLFESIYEQIDTLQHLSGNAVDLLTGTVLHDPQLLQPMDVAAFLRDFCAEANSELACQNAPARITLDLPAELELYLPASETLLSALLVNLVTNSVQARRDTSVTLRGTAGALRYSDTGPGPDAGALALLRGETVSLDMLRQGRMGLLVATVCAQDLGWQLDPCGPQENGFALEMRLPRPMAAPAAALHSALESEALRARLQRLLRRELAVALR